MAKNRKLQKVRSRLCELAEQRRIIRAVVNTEVISGVVNYHETSAGREYYFVRREVGKSPQSYICLRVFLSEVLGISSRGSFEYGDEHKINLAFNLVDDKERV
jgi:hypothetical protein